MLQIHLHGCPHFSHACSALFGLIYRPRDFASYMLGIFICNLLLYLAFYIIMKVRAGAGSGCLGPSGRRRRGRVRPRLLLLRQLRSSEKVLPVPLFCIVATAVMWAAALYFFFQNLSSWEVRGQFSYPKTTSLSNLPFWPFYLPLLMCFHSV